MFKIVPFTYYKMHRVLMKNFFWRLINIGGKQGITFLIFLITARLLLPEQLGDYVYALSILYLVLLISDFGVSTSVSKKLAEIKDVNQEDVGKIVFNASILIMTIAAIFSSGLWLYSKWNPSLVVELLILLIPSFFLAPLTSLYDGIYRGLKKFKLVSIITLLVGGLSVVFIVWFIRMFGLTGAIMAQNLYYGVLLLFLVWFERRFNLKVDREVIVSISRYAMIIGVANISYFLYSRADIFLLKYYGYVEEIGLYEAVYKYMNLALIPLMVLSQILAPDVARWYSSNQFTKVWDKAKKYFWVAGSFSVFIATVSVILSGELLQILIPKYESEFAGTFFLLMMIVFVFQSTSYVLANGFSIFTGHARLNTWVLLIAGIISIALNVLLIQRIGFEGLAITRLLVGVSANIIFISIYLRQLRQISRIKK